MSARFTDLTVRVLQGYRDRGMTWPEIEAELRTFPETDELAIACGGLDGPIADLRAAWEMGL